MVKVGQGSTVPFAPPPVERLHFYSVKDATLPLTSVCL